MPNLIEFPHNRRVRYFHRSAQEKLDQTNADIESNSQQATKIHNDPQLYLKRKGVRASFFQHQNVDLLEDQGKLALSYVAEAGFGDGVTDGATIFAHIEAWKKPESKTSYDFSLITSDFGVFSARATTQEQFDAWEEIMEKHQDKMVDPKTLRKKSSTIIV